MPVPEYDQLASSIENIVTASSCCRFLGVIVVSWQKQMEF